MKVNFVGGFLGSGKTTAIATACQSLMRLGMKVGVVTNDQGKLQVDTLFMRSKGIPATEVSDGCFCCRYDDFDEHLAALAEREQPDIIFAESVGSCADIVATVVKPFARFREQYGAGSVFSVFADSRLLLARHTGKRLPFSDDVLYVFDRQLAEADIIVLNKQDLLSEGDRRLLRDAVKAAYPGKPVQRLTATAESSVDDWLETLEGFPATHRPAIEMDYGRYGTGERELAWLDERITLADRAGAASDGSACYRAVLAILTELADRFARDGAGIGHVKFFIQAGGKDYKVSITGGDAFAEASGSGPARGWGLPPFTTRSAVIVANARVDTSPEALRAAFDGALASVRGTVDIVESDASVFRPGEPKPVHRIAE